MKTYLSPPDKVFKETLILWVDHNHPLPPQMACLDEGERGYLISVRGEPVCLVQSVNGASFVSWNRYAKEEVEAPILSLVSGMALARWHMENKGIEKLPAMG